MAKNQMMSPQIDDVAATKSFLEPVYWELLDVGVFFVPNTFLLSAKTKLLPLYFFSHSTKA